MRHLKVLNLPQQWSSSFKVSHLVKKMIFFHPKTFSQKLPVEMLWLNSLFLISVSLSCCCRSAISLRSISSRSAYCCSTRATSVRTHCSSHLRLSIFLPDTSRSFSTAFWISSLYWVSMELAASFILLVFWAFTRCRSASSLWTFNSVRFLKQPSNIR